MAAPAAYLYGTCRGMGFCICRGANGCSDELATTPEAIEGARHEPVRPPYYGPKMGGALQYRKRAYHGPAMNFNRYPSSNPKDKYICEVCLKSIYINDVPTHMKFAHKRGVAA